MNDLRTSTPFTHHSHDIHNQFNQQITPINNNDNNSQSLSSQQFADQYEQQLSNISNSFISLRQLKCLFSNATDDQLIHKQINVYGIVKRVIGDNTRDNRNNHLHKKVLLIDPTITDGILFIINNVFDNIVIKDILRLTNVSIVSSDNGNVFAVNERKNFTQIHTFSYDYSENSERNDWMIFPQTGYSLSDKAVSKLIEEWFARKFIEDNGFSKLPPVSSLSTSALYIDMVCMVLGMQLMKQSIQLLVYDGSKLSVNVEDQYDKHSNGEMPSNSFFRLNDCVWKPFENKFDKSYIAYVNIWKNQTNSYNNHYDAVTSLTLKDGDDLLILFNVELVCGIDDNSVKLHMRSGRHYGKCVRKVSRNSILGRKLMSNIACSQYDLNSSYGTIPRTRLFTDCTNSGDSNISMDQSSIVCIKLDAIIEQQEQQKNEPLIYRNEYTCDLNTIRQTLDRVRQKTILPFVCSLGSNYADFPFIQNLFSVRNLEMNKKFLVRAKLTKALPRTVFPQNKFIHLKCKQCQYYDTYQNYIHNFNSQSTTLLPSKVFQCPKCNSDKNSKLIYTYAILVDIEDDSASTQAIIYGNNALNMFKMDAFEIATDNEKAICFDNILYELVNNYNQTALLWVLKKSKNNSILRVINVSTNDN